MSFAQGFRSPRTSSNASIENGNKLGSRPVVRQSKLYRERESGNAMKGLFGQDHLSWKTEVQEGVFSGQGVYDAAADTSEPRAELAPLQTGAVCEEIEYP